MTTVIIPAQPMTHAVMKDGDKLVVYAVMAWRYYGGDNHDSGLIAIAWSHEKDRSVELLNPYVLYQNKGEVETLGLAVDKRDRERKEAEKEKQT